MRLFSGYLATLISLAVLDGLWILVVAKGLYARLVGFLFQPKIHIAPIAFFYPIYALGIMYLAVGPALKSGSATEALLRGAVLGSVAYAAYDLTNHATIAGWPLKMTLIDIAWGVVVTALASGAGYYFSRFILRT